MNELKLKKLSPQAVLPSRGSAESAGLDFSACLQQEIRLKPMEIQKIPTGIAMELPEGTAGFLFPRSGLGSKGITLSNCVGVIDRDYRGEVKIPVINLSGEDFVIRHGDRIAQLVILPVLLPSIRQTDSLSESVRGEGGFGSTGIESGEGT